VAQKVIDISVSTGPNGVSIRITDNGPGIPEGHRLFQPLQRGADATGLGLYLSRALMRSFRGDLRHDPEKPGCSFVLELSAATDRDGPEPLAVEHEADKTLTA
jgi:signal transduction histidine kinase